MRLPCQQMEEYWMRLAACSRRCRRHVIIFCAFSYATGVPKSRSTAMTLLLYTLY